MKLMKLNETMKLMKLHETMKLMANGTYGLWEMEIIYRKPREVGEILCALNPAPNVLERS